MQKRIFPILLFSLIPVFHVNAKPSVHWQERVAVIYVKNKYLYELQNKYQLSKDNFVHVKSGKGGSYYRVPLKTFRQIDAKYRTHIKNPPFLWIEPEIEKRRLSDDIAVLRSGYKDEVITEKILKYFIKTYPDYTKLSVIGKSLQGRPIYGLKVSRNPHKEEDEPSFMFAAALHGNEPVSIDYVLDMAHYVLENTKTRKNKYVSRAVENGEIWFVPIINPDGVHIFWNRSSSDGRKNARDTSSPGGWNSGDGVDLNRNFSFFWNSGHREASSGNPRSVFYRGSHAASEPEVQTMMKLAESERFVLSFTYHTFATKILTPYTIEGAQNPYPNNTFRVAQNIAKKGKSYRKNKDYIADKNLYPVDGTDQDWYFNQFGTFAYTVEGSFHTPEYRDAEKSIKGMLPMSIEMLKVYFKGPTLVVHTVNESGKPIAAEVRIAEIAHLSNEKLLTEKRFGRFDFVLFDADTYTIIAEKKGYRRFSKRIKCRKGVKELTIKMIPL
ncbi:MAG: M14 family zinc carboxypeptidase [Spirochaetia bacterium]|nr:M14 family zinc carboxypeptidase [Spirochaetia bacterium]